ncbi:hypothetical protein [Cupriavidus basilensis]|uniref:hypothetical protein n=1 Tax=Cupriavidus basilensis TaxID=68895 RepID=UPI0039F68481
MWVVQPAAYQSPPVFVAAGCLQKGHGFSFSAPLDMAGSIGGCGVDAPPNGVDSKFPLASECCADASLRFCQRFTVGIGYQGAEGRNETLRIAFVLLRNQEPLGICASAASIFHDLAQGALVLAGLLCGQEGVGLSFHPSMALWRARVTRSYGNAFVDLCNLGRT